MGFSMDNMQKSYISVGSNLGDREAHLKFALHSLEKAGESILKISSCFETEPVGFPDQPWFYNQAIELGTRLTPPGLLALCRRIETTCGRVRTFSNAPRILDLDILLFEDVVLNQDSLIIPHPRMSERRFVLEPLAQIAPDFMHPLLKKTIRSLLESCPDRSKIRLLPDSLPRLIR
jgi:2-amino-4-hydroxy-6-hydroxymethyldihydropteridine diphosphokinase